jgi:hypothetical protein
MKLVQKEDLTEIYARNEGPEDFPNPGIFQTLKALVTNIIKPYERPVVPPEALGTGNVLMTGSAGSGIGQFIRFLLNPSLTQKQKFIFIDCLESRETIEELLRDTAQAAHTGGEGTLVPFPDKLKYSVSESELTDWFSHCLEKNAGAYVPAGLHPLYPNNLTPDLILDALAAHIKAHNKPLTLVIRQIDAYPQDKATAILELARSLNIRVIATSTRPHKLYASELRHFFATKILFKQLGHSSRDALKTFLSELLPTPPHDGHVDGLLSLGVGNCLIAAPANLLIAELHLNK